MATTREKVTYEVDELVIKARGKFTTLDDLPLRELQAIRALLTELLIETKLR